MPKRLEAIQSEICINGGDAVLLYANENLEEACACVTLSNVDNIVPLMTFFLHEQPVLIPKIIKAIALAMEMNGKAESDDESDGDGTDDGNHLLDDMPMN